jgi:hypothetical protein
MTEKSEGGQLKVCEFCKCNTNARIRRCCRLGTVVDEGRILTYKQRLMFHDSHTPAPAMTISECMQGTAYLKEDEEVLKSILPLHMNKTELPDEQPTSQSNASDTTLESAKDIDDAFSIPFTYMPSHATEQPTASSKFLDDLMYSLAIDEANAELRAMLYESNE